MNDPIVELVQRVGLDEAAKHVADSIPKRNGSLQDPKRACGVS